MEDTKKRNTTLIIVGVVAGFCLILIVAAVLLVGALGRLASRAVSMDPAVAAEAAHRIADYDLPSGFSEQMAVSLPLSQVVLIAPGGGSTGPIIMLAQYEAGSSMTPEEMQRQISQSYNRPGAPPVGQMHVVETRAMTIRGFETEVVISEGAMQGGLVLRQLLTVFPGKSGQAMLMIQGMTDDWDEQVVDDFLESIR
jgi:hypothetical protein